ncbi:uncharacterized protein LOC132720367 [Ruditapes philippinarum]|jgi:hypothetical protein|uniref:uncharacterized protein LOC132720367 n=1 Tax=Ruditapes philippinarum TaxID=129788 RepID=UPI00295A8571|nr:uncharacterized protein LOC132720367 [Ruditapes philippinarum]XP_060560487.1 uncharacterized protein LOC132720367 [Ruditapes philippinarum]XP_060560493.1 uncharacterized protein LOC132720367 [Ruditapes philippinarum]XP_060560499.1 uncharacterized protein LOC132720367 [Ruditapes philippinarum]
MAHHRRGGKGARNDIINVTEIDDDLDEFSLSNKPKTITSGINGHVKPKYTDPLTSKSYKDPLKTITVKDPFAEKSKLNVISNHKLPESSLNNDSIFTKKTSQSSLTVQTGQKSGISTQSSSHATSTTTTTTPAPSRGFASSSTQFTRNQQFTTIQTNKRNNLPSRINKNQKGFSREEKDMYIDDIEDF